MPFFMKKPVAVEARQFTDEESGWAIVDWIKESVGENEPHGFVTNSYPGPTAHIVVPTAHGAVPAKLTDWVIKGPQDFYPITDEILRETYDPAEMGYAPENLGPLPVSGGLGS